MIKAGFETTDPSTGTRSIVIAGAEETDGRGWVLEVHCPANSNPSIPEHLHATWTETFEIVQGSACYKLGGEKKNAWAGDKILMPAGIQHIHPWNSGDSEMIYRQINDFGAATPEAVYDVLGVFATINGMAREGKINKKGLPKNPLQFAATLRTLIKHQGYDAAVPIPVQRAVSATLGRFAEMLGYRAVYPRYLQNEPEDQLN